MGARGCRWVHALIDRLPAAVGGARLAVALDSAEIALALRLLRRLVSGPASAPPSYVLMRWLFLRLLGVTYLCAFASLWVQVRGLIGQRGILPAATFLESARTNTGRERYWLMPTLAWLDARDPTLRALCGSGALLSVLLVAGIAPIPILTALWLLYLSLVTVCRVFLAYQWDALLLETGFLAIFLAPGRLWPGIRRESAPSPTVVRLLQWLLFRLMFSSGVVKLTSGDPTWRSLTALAYHYETQPLPAPTAWYMHQLPLWFQKLSTAFALGIELVAPFGIFGPRRVRLAASGLLALLQVLIVLTGNYAFFNLLSLALCLSPLDDACLRSLAPAGLRRRLPAPGHWPAGPRWRGWLVAPLAVLIGGIGAVRLAAAFSRSLRLPRPVRRTLEWLEPFRVVNSYGLFAVMTTERPEIVVEGSNDGATWLEYGFRYKPGDLYRPPRWVAPHQPRLDWQMWFAALGSVYSAPWFVSFIQRLLEGSPEVLDLLERNPFPDAPPRYIRALLYDYHFTDATSADGAWWRRELLGLYFPPVTLAQPEPE